ncbi:Shedu immune nuclease family protein [Saccharopolyspora sp. NPDC000359]|uniref:Shedu immune nuclease family protein n=1 Tax=Saccharopolyspora sp. NPDC000359 TaxID=3154251 RepID=UPI00331ACEE4
MTSADFPEIGMEVGAHCKNAGRSPAAPAVVTTAEVRLMTRPADWSLELQLEQLGQEAVDPDVKDAVADAIRYMRSGRSRNRRGGRELVRLLEIVRLRASEEAEWRVLQMVQDSLDYLNGALLRPDFEERYRIHQDEQRSESNRDWVARTFATLHHFLKWQYREVVEKRPTATAEEVLQHLLELSNDGRFVDAPADRPGRYRVVRGRSEMALWLERVFRHRIDIEDPGEAARRVVSSPDALAALADDAEASALLKAAELKRQAESLVEIRRIAEDPDATEHSMQAKLEAHPWIFGGRFVGASARRRLVPGDEIDIPLIRADGSLHVVELKRSMGVPIVKRHRNAWVPTAEVHDAVSQVINYLVGLDEHRKRIRDEFGVETRRASGMVIIGHPAHHSEIGEEEVDEALRLFNSHLSRVEVMTYKDLLDSAERALTWTNPG